MGVNGCNNDRCKNIDEIIAHLLNGHIVEVHKVITMCIIRTAIRQYAKMDIDFRFQNDKIYLTLWQDINYIT